VFEDKRLLVVDDSRTMTEVLKTVLTPLHRKVLTAPDVAGARACLSATPGVDLVVCDVVLPDGSGFDVLAHAHAGKGERPEVILMTARVSEADRERAASEGALAYLSKPISLPDIRRAWSERAEGREVLPRTPRRRTLARVSVVGSSEEGRQLQLMALDVSSSGAFLASPGPLPVGTKLALELELGDRCVHASATVVRVQEPTWMNAPGLGVRFEELEEEARTALDRFVAERGSLEI
jgi:uncharacterized protein (TIGR02266 family)